MKEKDYDKEFEEYIEALSEEYECGDIIIINPYPVKKKK